MRLKKKTNKIFWGEHQSYLEKILYHQQKKRVTQFQYMGIVWLAFFSKNENLGFFYHQTVLLESNSRRN